MSSSVGIDANLARLKAALRFLYDRIDYERARRVPYGTREFKLDRMRELLARVGNPQEAMPIVHVAGTKGKGSTAVMIGGVLSASGYRAGVFTSPHLDRIEQRMAVDGRPCSSDELVELVELLEPAVRAMDEAAAARKPAETGPTYFEITTAMALVHFARRKADAAVLEVGLGGRLDSTNVCRPEVAVITSISFDHTEQLGNTLESIAREKAGIVKPGVPVISGVTAPGPQEVIRRVCARQGCRLVELGIDFDFDYHPPRHLEQAPAVGKIDFRYRVPGREHQYHGLALALLGRHQATNAAVALAVLAELQARRWTIPEAAIRTALEELVWPVRVELVARRPAIVVDAAHNRASIDALMAVLDESFSPRRRLLVFGTTLGKDIPNMLDQLLGQFDHVVFTRYLNNPRAVPPEELAVAAMKLTGRLAQVCPQPADAWDEIRRLATPEDLVCVTGSFFIAAEMRQQIQTRPLDVNKPKDS